MSSTARPGNGNNFPQHRERFAKSLEAWKAENARRIKCAHCPLMILPETMEKHLRICHADQQ